jgi:hypothetical protein
MDPLELIAYCRTHRSRIFVRVWRNVRWVNVPLSEMTATEVLDHLELWIVRGQTPARVLDDALAKPSPDPDS